MMDDNKINAESTAKVEGNVVKLSAVKSARKVDKAPKNVHAGHRGRLRNRFIKEGLDSFEEHNALELFLFYAIPNKDVNDLAHSLINHFGSFSAVFDAPFEELCKVKGISEYSASLIKLMPAMARKYEQDKFSREELILDTPKKIAKYMSINYLCANREEVWLLCFDNASRLLKCVKISAGDVDKAVVSYRTIAEQIIISNAAYAVIVHNHISGITSPSTSDIVFTANLIDSMRSIQLNIRDHIIIGHKGEYLSLSESRKWCHIFNK